MGCRFTKGNNLDEERICKIVKVFDHTPNRETRKYRYLEPKGEICLVKHPHDIILVMKVLDNWNIEPIRL